MKQDVASRREFVKGGLAAAAAIGLAGCDGASVPGQMIAPVEKAMARSIRRSSIVASPSRETDRS